MYVLIAVLIVAVLAIYAISQRQQQTGPESRDGKTPTTEEGQTVRKIYGTVWVSDPPLIAFKKMGTIPIRTKGGKK